MEKRAKAGLLKIEVSLLVDRLHYGPKQNVHDKSRVRDVCEKEQTEDFCAHCLTDENVAIIRSASDAEHARARENVLTFRQLHLDFPDEEDEDFDDHAHRVASIFESVFFIIIRFNFLISNALILNSTIRLFLFNFHSHILFFIPFTICNRIILIGKHNQTKHPARSGGTYLIGLPCHLTLPNWTKIFSFVRRIEMKCHVFFSIHVCANILSFILFELIEVRSAGVILS